LRRPLNLYQMPDNRIINRLYRILKSYAAFCIPLAVGVVMLSWSWRRWPDSVIDFGRELYIPWRINNGSVLYKDIAYFFGPLSPYLNAFLFKVFGTSLMTLVIFNIILIVILSFIIYRIFRITTDRTTATAVTATFLALFAFSQHAWVGNYNFVCPYAHGLTHGIFLSFLAIYVFLIYLEKRANKLIFLIGILTGLIFLTKVEVFFAISAAMFLGMLLLMFADKTTLPAALKTAGTALFGFLIPVVFFTVYLSRFMPLNKTLESIVLPYAIIFRSTLSSNIFYQDLMGTGVFFRENIFRLLLVAVWYLSIITAFGLINYGRLRLFSRDWIVAGLVALPAIFFLFMTGVRIIHIAWEGIFRALPLLTLFLGGYLFISLLRFRPDRQKRRQPLVLLVITVFAFCLLLKIFFNAKISRIGFALAMPATLLLVMAFLYYIPIFLGRNNGGINFIRIISLILIGVVLLVHMGVSRKLYRYKTCLVGSGSDTIFDYYTLPGVIRGVYIRQVIDEIERVVKKEETFVVFPDGVMLNYLTRRVNPTAYVTLMPPEVEVFGEEAMLESFIKTEPDYFILMNVDMSYFGCPSRCRYCGDKIREWIDRDYATVFTVGYNPLLEGGFGVTIVKRIAPAP
jgi:4-amino-4-deoxy-L-arabinose transferase-like glycosyltransferase